ncbi:MAG: M48 family metalloprotease [Clostridia bacterium]|nr:M48 family metalloprotease [Clostridia bacterium]
MNQSRISADEQTYNPLQENDQAANEKKSLYFIDFFKGLFNKSHVGTIIWMVLNQAVICTAFVFLLGTEDAQSILLGIGTGIVVYLLSLVIALSPVGEFVLRFQTKCKSIEKYPEVAERLMPLFGEVYAKARKNNPTLSSKVRLYVNEDDVPNAFATGRATVCVTAGLLSMNNEQIKGILGHEFGHLAHKDTYMLQAVSVGNLFVSIIFFIVKLVVDVMIWITRITLHIMIDSIVGRVFMWIAGGISKLIVDIMLSLLMYLWTRLGVAVCMASSRSQEFEADRYSCVLGYGQYLSQALRDLEGSSYGKSKKKTLWAAVSASHPDTELRVEKINQYLYYGIGA